VPPALFKQPALVQLMLLMALVIFPAVAWVDYRQGYHFSALVEVLASVVLIGLGLLIRPLGTKRASRSALIVMFLLAALGSVEKLGSTPNFAWFTVVPFLYISLGGARLGGILTAAHLAFIVVCYALIATPVAEAIPLGTWIQVGLAYLTAAGLAISYERVQRQLRHRLRDLAEHDPLTGLLNRRGMEKRLQELSGFLRRHDVVVTLALLDIDHFKQVNDAHGHDAGDAVLQELSRTFRRVFRSADYLSRWGGDEFLLALTRTGVSEASVVLERLKTEIGAMGGLPVPAVTLSMGAAEWQPGIDLATALKQADLALYAAKGRGRDKLIASVPARSSTGETAIWSLFDVPEHPPGIRTTAVASLARPAR
jgi:diguanylate cyclase (GGDEF)-like protein